MTPPIASQEILPDRPPETEPRLRDVEDRLLALKNKQEEKSQTVKQSKSELETIRGSIDALEKGGGINMEHVTALRTSLAEIELELEKEVVPETEEAVTAEAETIPTIEKPTIVQEWFPTSADPREWSAKQIASVSTLTLGIVGLFAWWKARKQRKNVPEDGESEPKRGVLGKLLFWIPGIGLTVAIGIAGHQMLLKYEGYAKNYEAMKKKVGDAAVWGKSHLPVVEENIDKEQELPPHETTEADPDRKILDEEKLRQVREASERASRMLAATGLLIMFPARVREAGLKEETERDAVGILLNNKKFLTNTTVSSLQSSGDEKRAKELLGDDATASDRKALVFLSLVSKDLENGIRGAIKNAESTLTEDEVTKKIQSMSLEEFFDSSQHAAKMFSRISTVLEGKSITDIPDLDTVLGAAFSPESAIEEILHDPVVSTSMNSLGLEGRKEGFALYACSPIGMTTRLKDVDVQPEDSGEVQAYNIALISIRDTMLAEETFSYLRQYLHGRHDKDFEGKLREYIQQDLTVFDAVQLYGYLRLAESGGKELPHNLDQSSPIGAFLLQMKIIDLLQKKDDALGKRMRAHVFLGVIDGKDVNVPEETVETLRRLASTTGTTLGNAALKKLQRLGQDMYLYYDELQQKHPYPVHGTEAVAGVVGATMVYRWWTRDWVDIMANRLGGKAWSESLQRKIPWWSRLTEVGREAWNPASTTKLADKLLDVKTAINSASDAGHVKKLKAAYNSLHYRGYLPSSFQQFYQELAALKKSGIPSSVIKQIAEQVYVLERDHAAVLQRRRFGFLRRQSKNVVEAGRAGIDVTKDAYTALRSSPFIGDALKAAGVSLENFLNAVKSAKMPPQLAALFAKSKGGMRMLVDAFRRAGAPSIAYITKLANCVPLAKLAGPLSAVGFDAVFIALERSILNGKIEETDSVALKEFYETKKNLTVVSTVPTAGFLALGAGPGLLLTGVYMGTKATSDYFDKATIDWLKSDKDMAKLPPGELLSKLNDIAPGSQAWNHQNAARGDSLFGGSILKQIVGLNSDAEKRFKVVEQTNNGQRGKLSTAYLTTMTYLAERSGESQAQYAERFARFQSEQNVFIARVSGGSFGPQRPETYRKAHGHAELALLSRELTVKNASQFIPLTHDEGSGHFVSDGEFDLREYDDLPPFGQATAEGLTRDDVIASWLRHQEAVTMAEAALTPENSEEKKGLIRDRLLQSVRYELSALDAKLATADLKGWEWTGGEQSTREKIRSAARGAFMDRLSTESALLATTADGGLDQIRQSITRLRSFLQEDMAVFVALSDKVSTAASAEARLDWRTMAAETLAA